MIAFTGSIVCLFVIKPGPNDNIFDVVRRLERAVKSSEFEMDINGAVLTADEDGFKKTKLSIEESELKGKH